MSWYRVCALLAGAIVLPASSAASASDAAPAPLRVPPVRLECKSYEPEYPPGFNAALRGGSVRIKSLVDETGNVLDVQVQEPSGNEQLDASAVDWARTCRFKPGTRDGAAEKVWAIQKVSFSHSHVPPERLQCGSVLPPYPHESGGVLASGYVRLLFQVAENGDLADVRLEKSSGNDALDSSAMAWGRTCRFRPAKRNGIPQKEWASQGVFFQQGRICAAPDIEYPLSSRRNGESGEVTVKYQLDASGTPVQLAVARSAGHSALDNAVLDYVSQCRHDVAASGNGAPDTWFTFKYRFTLRD